jgi:hypothetical protein
MKYVMIIAAISLTILLSVAPGSTQEMGGGSSQIDSIGSDEIVIGDSTYRIAPHAVFYSSPGKTKITLSQFEIGDRVEFNLNDNGEIETMWLSSE